MPTWITRIPAAPDRNPLVPVVRSLPAAARRGLYAAAGTGTIRRGSWKGCAFNVAGTAAGLPVRSRGEAACAFGTTPQAIRDFIEVWDQLWGSNRRCAALLRAAIDHVGLADPAPGSPSPADLAVERIPVHV